MSQAVVTTGTSAITITVAQGGCTHEHEHGWGTLGCFWHDYEHVVGLYCRVCHEQFWWPNGLCERPDGLS